MITPQEVLEYRRLKIVEEYIDNELKKGNFVICLNQFKEDLSINDVDLIIEKYKDVGWEIDDQSSFIKNSYTGEFYGWMIILLNFKIPENLR